LEQSLLVLFPQALSPKDRLQAVPACRAWQSAAVATSSVKAGSCSDAGHVGLQSWLHKQRHHISTQVPLLPHAAAASVTRLASPDMTFRGVSGQPA
jgi:hypothetical protein